MYYCISFVVLTRRSDPVLMRGPEGFDVQSEYDRFKERVLARLGPEPSFLEPRTNWALRSLQVLRELQLEYECVGDYEVVFIEHLRRRCGFEQLGCVDCRLA